MPITSSSFRGQSEKRAMPSDDDMDDRAASKKTMIKTGKGKPDISFKPGGLHESLGVPQGEPIPSDLMAAALAGKHGPKAQKQANLAKTLSGMRPAARGTLPPELAAHAFTQKGGGTRILGPEAGAMLVPTAVLGSNKKKRAQGGSK